MISTARFVVENLLRPFDRMRKRWNWQIENKLINKYFIMEMCPRPFYRLNGLNDYDIGKCDGC